MEIKATNPLTGEVVNETADTPEQIVAIWRLASSYEKLAKKLKDQLKPLVPTLIGPKGVSEEIQGHVFRQTVTQRMTYDKAVLREVLDADTFDVLMMPDKGKVDNYIKENLEQLGGVSTKLRQSMVPLGSSYQIIRLEALDGKK
jgi:hypothetical protein